MSTIESHAHDLRDNVPGALDHDPITDADVLALDLVLIVERRVRDGDATDPDRIESRDRRERAGAADLELDRLEGRLRLLGRELEGDRPARRAGEGAEAFLLVESVDLEHGPVDLDRQVAALRE